MEREIPITSARHKLTSLPERLAEEPGAVAVTRRGIRLRLLEPE